MADLTPWQQALLYANRANPYPFYAELRKTPVSRQPDGSYIVSTYREIVSLLSMSSFTIRSSGEIFPRLRKPQITQRAWYESSGSYSTTCIVSPL